MPDKALTYYFAGLGYKPIFVEGEETLKMHETMMHALDDAVIAIKRIKEAAKIGRAHV